MRRSSASVVSPSFPATRSSASSTPWEKSRGVEGALAVTMRPPASMTTQSVNVPPVSMPQMKSIIPSLSSRADWRGQLCGAVGDLSIAGGRRTVRAA